MPRLESSAPAMTACLINCNALHIYIQARSRAHVFLRTLQGSTINTHHLLNLHMHRESKPLCACSVRTDRSQIHTDSLMNMEQAAAIASARIYIYTYAFAPFAFAFAPLPLCPFALCLCMGKEKYVGHCRKGMCQQTKPDSSLATGYSSNGWISRPLYALCATNSQQPSIFATLRTWQLSTPCTAPCIYINCSNTGNSNLRTFITVVYQSMQIGSFFLRKLNILNLYYFCSRVI